MKSEKQIEEMANDLAAHCPDLVENCCGASSCVSCLTRFLHTAGYRKQSEGHWFILEYEYFTCSECGYYHPNGCDSTQEAKEKLADGKVPKYCSECGAKMKGGEQ